MAAWGARTGHAGLLEQERGSGEGGFSFEERARVSGGSRTDPDRRLRFWVKMPLRGQLGGERNLNYRVVLRPSSAYSPKREGDDAVRLRQFDFDAGFRLVGIPSTTLSGSLARGRSRGERGGAPLSETDVKTRSLALAFRLQALPLSAEHTHRDSRLAWSVSPFAPLLEQGERTGTWRLEAQNSRTTLRYERTRQDNRVSARDYEAWSAVAGHALRWGKGSRLQSSYQRSERDGSSRFLQSSWEESLHLQHLRPLSTDWAWSQHTVASTGSESRSTFLRGSLDHRPRQWLAWGIGASSSLTRSRDLESKSLALAPRLSLDHLVGRRLRVHCSADATFERREERGTEGLMLDRADERHIVGSSRSFLLEMPRVDTASVEIRVLDPLILLIRGVDYVLYAAGDRTEVNLTPAGRAMAGQTLQADYRFRTDARPETRSATLHYRLGLEYRSFSLRHTGSTRGTDEGRLGRPVGAPDEQSALTELEGRGRTPLGALTGRARHETRRSERFFNRTQEVHLELSGTTPGAVETALSAEWSRRTGSGGRLVVLSATARTGWAPMPWVRLGATLQGYSIRRPGTPDERIMDAGLSGDFRVAQLESSVRYREQWSRPDSRGGVRVVSLQLQRRF
ncbi:MAG: hypothetical protein HZB25_09665 [Candidatus Eisenbacteria bacterium]|nr:hypothetical protein [Candidatus Eisenbacteria bacterium]